MPQSIRCSLVGTFIVGASLATCLRVEEAFADTATAATQPATAPSALLDVPESLRPPYSWVSTGSLIRPIADEAHQIISVKDPTVVFFEGKWHVYATTADTRNRWHMVYLSFDDWSKAGEAKLHYLDANPNLRGYRCAPQLFYFAPQKKWYLIFQAQQPQFSTADRPDQPEAWTKPQDFFKSKPASVRGLWIDYWIICDDAHAYLFFTNDDGVLYRSRTTLDRFPEGFDEPVVAIERKKFDLFEAGCTYKIKGTGKYLTLVEAIGRGGVRYYTAYIADSLDGEWHPLADNWDSPFASMTNVRFEAGTAWTHDISHGELIRDGYDQTPTIDPENLQLLYQGRDPTKKVNGYPQLPYELGLLRLERDQERK